MATKAGVGISRHHNPNVAGHEAAEQALQNAGVSKPDFVLMFGQSDMTSTPWCVWSVRLPEVHP